MDDRADNIEIQKRIYQVGLMLFRKPKKIIVEFIGKTWDIEKSQAYNYIRLATKEWQKYFTNVKRWGMGYHLAKRREIRDKAMEDKDYRIVLDADKDEAKLMGIYPAEKLEVKEEYIVIGAEEEKKKEDIKK